MRSYLTKRTSTTTLRTMPVEVSKFGDAKQYSISNVNKSIVVKVIDYGATITHLFVPDRNGIPRDIVLGFDSIEGYRSSINPYFGAVCGRIANRVSNASFKLNDQTYPLAVNNQSNCLHGGLEGFDKRFWTTTIVNDQTVEFSLTSPDMDQGFPGKLNCKVIYAVEGNNLHIDYEAQLADGETKSTIINLTNHAYFNLGGASSLEMAKIDNHFVKMSDEVKAYLDKTDEGVPSGKIMLLDSPDVKSGPMDFRQPHTIGERIAKVPKRGMDKGYDHCYLIGEQSDPKEPLVSVWCEDTGIKLTFETHEPSFQL